MTVLEAAKQLGIEIESICGGKGLCGKCKIKILENSPLPPTNTEKGALKEDEIDQGYRLACKLKPASDIIVEIPSISRRREMRLQTEGVVKVTPFKPAVKKFFIRVPKASLHDQRSDEDRFLEALQETSHLPQLRIYWPVIRELPQLLRENNWNITAIVWGNQRAISVEPGDTSNCAYGIAVDIGSTKIALYLLDLIEGDEVMSVSLINPQRSYGEDIMTRLTFANRKPENRTILQDSILNAINNLIRKVCVQTKIHPKEIYEAVIVGNTVMHHFFLGLDTRYLSLSPYTQVLRRPLDTSSSNIGLKINRNGNVHLLPTIRSFVGADNVAVCLATQIMNQKRPTLALDIGTNTEIDCGSVHKGLTVTSTPSGPAFEGWATKYGVTATDGAIERIYIDPSSREIMYRTIDDTAPMGICGSGYIDALAEMLKTGILDQRTAINKDLNLRHIRKGPEGYEVVIAPQKESLLRKDIVITQKDIGELIKAKAAIHAAITLLLRHLEIKESDLDKIFLAGAFGSYIDPENARTIGLLPEVELNQITPIGNAAGSGAKMTLLNIDERKVAKGISEKASFIELATHPDFIREYADSMYLPYKNLDKYPQTAEILEAIKKRSPLSI